MTRVCHDVLIVGGGPAGSTTALALAHAAPELTSRILLLERARYPRDKPCAGAIGGRGDLLLESLGVRVDVPSVQLDGISFKGVSAEATARPGRIGRVVRRIEFDHALALAVASRGIAVRQEVTVRGARRAGSAGAIVDTTEGERSAAVVVGCDGVGSVVRRALGLGPGGLRAQVIEVDTEPLEVDRDRALLRVDVSDRRVSGYAWDFPTVVGGRPLVCRGIYRLKIGAPERRPPDLSVLLDERLRAMGVDPASCQNKRYAERGYEPASRLAGGPLMLVGEAAGIDPATGEGIAQSIEYGLLAGRFLAARLRAAGAEPVVLDGWSGTVERSRLARDLRMRTRLVRLFLGPARAPLERLLTRSPDVLQVGCRHFAGQPFDWGRTARAVACAATTAVGTPLWR